MADVIVFKSGDEALLVIDDEKARVRVLNGSVNGYARGEVAQIELLSRHSTAGPEGRKTLVYSKNLRPSTPLTPLERRIQAYCDRELGRG